MKTVAEVNVMGEECEHREMEDIEYRPMLCAQGESYTSL